MNRIQAARVNVLYNKQEGQGRTDHPTVRQPPQPILFDVEGFQLRDCEISSFTNLQITDARSRGIDFVGFLCGIRRWTWLARLIDACPEDVQGFS